MTQPSDNIPPITPEVYQPTEFDEFMIEVLAEMVEKRARDIYLEETAGNGTESTTGSNL